MERITKKYYPEMTLDFCTVLAFDGEDFYDPETNDPHKAMAALTDKLFDDMPEEDRIAEFVKTFPEKDKPYPNQDLFDWHHRLTGSCMAGRNAFVKDRGLTLDGCTTVAAFIQLTENAYGGSTIRKLKEQYKICALLGLRNDGPRKRQ